MAASALTSRGQRTPKTTQRRRRRESWARREMTTARTTIPSDPVLFMPGGDIRCVTVSICQRCADEAACKARNTFTEPISRLLDLRSYIPYPITRPISIHTLHAFLQTAMATCSRVFHSSVPPTPPSLVPKTSTLHLHHMISHIDSDSDSDISLCLRLCLLLHSPHMYIPTPFIFAALHPS